MPTPTLDLGAAVLDAETIHTAIAGAALDARATRHTVSLPAKTVALAGHALAEVGNAVAVDTQQVLRAAPCVAAGIFALTELALRSLRTVDPCAGINAAGLLANLSHRTRAVGAGLTLAQAIHADLSGVVAGALIAGENAASIHADGILFAQLALVDHVVAVVIHTITCFGHLVFIDQAVAVIVYTITKLHRDLTAGTAGIGTRIQANHLHQLTANILAATATGLSRLSLGGGAPATTVDGMVRADHRVGAVATPDTTYTAAFPRGRSKLHTASAGIDQQAFVDLAATVVVDPVTKLRGVCMDGAVLRSAVITNIVAITVLVLVDQTIAIVVHSVAHLRCTTAGFCVAGVNGSAVSNNTAVVKTHTLTVATAASALAAGVKELGALTLIVEQAVVRQLQMVGLAGDKVKNT